VQRNRGFTQHLLLDQEVRALLVRLRMIKPFALHESMVPAAGLRPAILRQIDGFLMEGRNRLQKQIREYLQWLESPAGQEAPPATAYRHFVALRMLFNGVVHEQDIFADVLTQRGSHEIGVHLAGLDALATDALRANGDFYPLPGMFCYLDRGHGAAIRRVRTPMPGGGMNPVALIKIPRERMISSGVASSLIHEVGHQGAALLQLTESLRNSIDEVRQADPTGVWAYWSRCLGEILSDLWAVAKVGITASIGLIGVVTLPRSLVFRINPDGPHPVPWIRVLLSIHFGRTLFPHPQWDRLEGEWLSYYPATGLPVNLVRGLERMVHSIPALTDRMIHHRPRSLHGQTVQEVLVPSGMLPEELRSQFHLWQENPSLLGQASPCKVFAVLGQARYHGLLRPERESSLLRQLLNTWALQHFQDPIADCDLSSAHWRSHQPLKLTATGRR
jgi:hypothetical protein